MEKGELRQGEMGMNQGIMAPEGMTHTAMK
jgi:hypothetical protein